MSFNKYASIHSVIMKKSLHLQLYIRKMTKKLFIFLTFLFCILSDSLAGYRTETFNDAYKSLQVKVYGIDMSEPTIFLDSDDRIEISFDEMSRTPRDLVYIVEHCSALWESSELDKIDYLEGFDQQDVTDYEYARNTTFDYTHYSLLLPNDDVKMTLSGNYVVKIADREKPDSVLLTACFSVAERLVDINAEVKSNTMYGINTKYQQVNLELGFDKLGVTPSDRELIAIVRQNVRWDNAAYLNIPNFTRANTLIWENDEKLLFDAGNEWYRIDFSDKINFNGEIRRIQFHRPYYHVEVLPGFYPSKPDYEWFEDQDGRYRIHGQNITSYYDIDYSIVHFAYKTDWEWPDGFVFVAGDFNHGYLNERNLMKWNNERKQYELDIVLKNGGYNFQYVFLPNGERKASPDRLTISHWQTENEYYIYVYYKRLGERYYRLIGSKKIKNK